MNPRAHRLLRPLILAGALALPLHAIAQPFCGLRHSVRLAQGIGDSGGGDYLQFDPPIATVGPFVSTVGLSPSNACGCNSQSSVVMQADYGSLAYSVSASGVSCPCNGIFLFIDGGIPKTRFFDRLTFTSASLPNGAPIQVRATLRLDGGITWQNNNSARSFGAFFSFNGDQIALSNQPGTVTRTFNLTVGQFMDVSAGITCEFQDYVLLGFNQTGSFSANLAAFTTIEVLTPGITVTSCSGRDYRPLACDSIDFNNDTSFFDPTDIDAFLSVFSEGPCIPSSATCNDIDFNNDGSLFDPCDIDSFLLAFSEGPCTLCGQ